MMGLKTIVGMVAVVVLCSARSWSAAAEPAAPVETSLVSNGTFVLDANGDEWPDGWAHPAGATWEKEGDLRFLRLQSSKPGQTVMIYRQIALPTPLPPGLEYRLKVRYTDIKRGEKKWFDGRIMGNFKDEKGKTIKKSAPAAPSFIGSSKGWVEKSVFMRVPAHAKTLEIMPCLFQAAGGTLEFSRLEIYPAPEEKLPKPLPLIPSETITPAALDKLPPELHVVSNELHTAAGKAVWLQGLCIDSMEWSGAGEKITQSVVVATTEWKSNVIRLPVKDNFWFGRGPWQKKGEGGLSYRKLVDQAVAEAAARGAYLVLDLHRFGAPMAEDVEFWKDAATRYKNHPAVLFDLFNEPHDLSWKVWRDGGDLKGPENKTEDVNPVENKEVQDGEVSVGMQALVDAVRSTGARNIVIAGGLDWSYTLSGVLKGFALDDRNGNGIMYSHHNYPWKKGWQKAVVDVAAKYPIFVGEVGCPQKWEDFSFIKEGERYEKLGPGCEWPADMLGLIQKYKLNWTGFSFHPKCGPMVISDWNYTPTPYWGVFVKEALAGKQFEMKRIR